MVSGIKKIKEIIIIIKDPLNPTYILDNVSKIYPRPQKILLTT